jgi:hypothetical protein
LINLAFGQHYGLPTPALDVTRDARVALWFALHSITGVGPNTSVVSPASGSDGVVYVIAGDPGQYFGEKLTGEKALRPHRQRGGFLASNWGNSKNRVARYVVCAIYFPHTMLLDLAPVLPTAERLFPGPTEDPFVALIQQMARRDKHGSTALQEIAEHVYWIEPKTDRDGREASRAGEPRATTVELERLARSGDAEAGLRS